MQALAELTARIKVLDREINLLAKTKYPQSAHLEQIPGVGPDHGALFRPLKIEDPARLKRCAMWGLMQDYVRDAYQSGESDPQLRVSPSVETPICAGFWSARLSISSVLSVRRAPLRHDMD